MPELKDLRKEIKASISSIKDSEVTLKDGLLAGDMGYVYGNNNTSDVDRTLRALARVIVDWNLTDSEGKKLPITLENIEKLNISDLLELINKTSFGDLGVEPDSLKKK